MDISAKITGIEYTPLLCRSLETFDFVDLDKALSTKATFILNIDKEKKVAVSWWVSAKRTRSYPYPRVYDSLGFAGRKVTIIPILKEEGLDGDRDFIQWDTISLMSLLGVYVIVGYYIDAQKSKNYDNKITKQRFDTEYIRNEIIKLLSYQSDPLHWNIKQAEKVGEIGERALKAYRVLFERLGMYMHSDNDAEEKIKGLLEGKEEFLKSSRELAQRAQHREVLTTQPKEKVSGTKATITITNYLGGKYYFTSDETEIKGGKLYLFECKHSKKSLLPSKGDIKDGLLKMILFCNLNDVTIGTQQYKPVPILKLTTENIANKQKLSASQEKLLLTLKKEAEKNGFKVLVL
jgi:hypothetical protein